MIFTEILYFKVQIVKEGQSVKYDMFNDQILKKMTNSRVNGVNYKK